MRSILAVCAVAFLTSCAEPARPQTPLFERASAPVTVGHGSGKVVLIDVNRDGHLDLVTQHLLDSVVNVHLGDGKGAFVKTAGAPVRLTYQPGTIALADVDSDGAIDIGVAYRTEGGEYVAILRGDGKGGFTRSLGGPTRTSAAMEFYKPILRLVDVNSDTKPDIVTANGRRHTVEVLLGDGAGKFSARQVVQLGSAGQGLSSFAVGDVDGDGHTDLVASNSLGPDLGNMNKSVLLTIRGDGTGSFAAGMPSPAPAGAILETLADVNSDARLDAVFSHGARHMLGVALNDGKGRFAASAPLQAEPGAEVFAIVVDDVNADGKGDLVAATVQNEAAPFASMVQVFLRADSGFVRAPGSPFPAGQGSYNLALGDVNGDGKLDVASSSFGGNAVTLLLGRARR